MKSTIAVLHNNKKIGAKKCRRLNKPVSEYRSRILHTAIARQCSPPLAGNSFQIIHIAAACGCVCRRTLRGRLMTHTVLIRADFYKRRFTSRSRRLRPLRRRRILRRRRRRKSSEPVPASCRKPCLSRARPRRSRSRPCS